MYIYQSEILDTVLKWGPKDSANEKDVAALDELINQRTAEGWEFVAYSYMANVMSTRSAILVTFRKAE